MQGFYGLQRSDVRRRRRIFLNPQRHRDRIELVRLQLPRDAEVNGAAATRDTAELPLLVESNTQSWRCRSARVVKTVCDDTSLKGFFDRVVVLERGGPSGRRFASHLAQLDWPFATPRRCLAFANECLTPPVSWRGDRAGWAQLRSHLRVIEDALADGVQSVLILEDLARFNRHLRAGAAAFLGNLPDDWQQVSLGGQHEDDSQRSSRWVNRHVVVADQVVSTFAYGLHRRAMGLWYALLTGDLASVSSSRQGLATRMTDLQQSGRFAIYAPTQWLAVQELAQPS